MNTESKQLGSLYLTQFQPQYHIRKVGVIKVAHDFGWDCWYGISFLGKSDLPIWVAQK